ncbi:DUF5813 family protein [Halobaculum sp. D14]|uniref:DUF5813 family protein n=1 Tax=Halobaculum sp. D14 TaxID=3421642 RepID=UPI003EC09773
MSDSSGRVGRAFRDHDAFADEPVDGAYESTSTAFDAVVTAAERDDGRVAFDVTVTVPTLQAVTAGDVADVVADGWYETFERRVADIGAVTEADRDLSPSTVRGDGDATVTAAFTDLDERRGVNDAAAVIDYVGGTYVQGVIPGYDYEEPVSGLIDTARAAANSDGI